MPPHEFRSRYGVKVGIIFDSEEPNATPPSTEATAARTTAPNANESAVVTNLPELWTKLLEATNRTSQFTHTYLRDGHLVSIENNVITIGFATQFKEHVGLLDNRRNHTLLVRKLGELGYPDTRIRFIKAE